MESTVREFIFILTDCLSFKIMLKDYKFKISICKNP